MDNENLKKKLLSISSIDILDQHNAIRNLAKQTGYKINDLKETLRYLKQEIKQEIKEKEEKRKEKAIQEERTIQEQERQKKISEYGQPFIVLGYDEYETNIRYYWNEKCSMLVKMAVSCHNSATLIQLAPLEYWATKYPSNHGEFATSRAIADLIMAGNDAGSFSENKLRGAGIWEENEKVIINNGDQIIKNTDYFYRAGIRFYVSKFGLQKEAGKDFLNSLFMISWSTRINALYLAGWIFLAPLCGILRWRPHLWLTAESGSGKTWIINHIIKPLFSGFASFNENGSTEAGIRGELSNGARPVVYDEADANDQRSQSIIKRVVDLARSSSSSDLKLVKGTASGGKREYTVNSMFLFASIIHKAISQADKSRITMLELKRSDDDNKFLALSETIRMMINSEFAGQLKRRAINMLPIIQENIRLFSDMVMGIVHDRRESDQIGTLLGGCYSLTHDIIVDDDALNLYRSEIMINRNEDKETDHEQLFDTIMGMPFRSSSGDNTTITLSIIDYVLDDSEKARRDLSVYGIGIIHKNDYDNIKIGIHHRNTPLLKYLKNAEYFGDLKNILLRIPGSEGNTFSCNGLRVRGVVIPINEMIKNIQEHRAQNEGWHRDCNPY